jgi:hypothetical protein
LDCGNLSSPSGSGCRRAVAGELLSDKNVYFIDRPIEISSIACLDSRRFRAARLDGGEAARKPAGHLAAMAGGGPGPLFLKLDMMMLMNL